MSRTAFAVAVVTGVCAQQALAAGFIDDSKASVTARNFYFNGDNRDGTANPSKQEEWGQGFIVNYQSGFTEGTVGFGLDALGLLGIKLDSGKGTAYNAGSSGGGQLFPSGSDNRAKDEFGSLGATAKVRFSKTEARLGTLQPKLPVVTYNDGRLLPQTFEGGQINSHEIKDLSLVAGKLEHAKARNSTSADSLSIAGSNSRTGQRSNAFYYAGGDYAFSKNLVAQYYYGNLEDFYTQHFLGLKHNVALPVGGLKTDLRYFYSDSDGKNASPSGRLEGYKASGKSGTTGEVDNRTWSVLSTYSLNGHSIGAGYQQSSGDSDFPFLNQGDGATAYLITNKQIGKFQRAGERTWLAQYGYDFANVGVQGLTTSMSYLSGSHIQAAGSGDEWERDFTLSYVVPEGDLKGLGFAWRNASLRSGVTSQRNQDQNRLILSYTLALF
jgi:hypothetical protein